MLGFLGRRVTRDLMEKADEKRKRMKEKSLSDFKVVENEAKNVSTQKKILLE